MTNLIFKKESKGYVSEFKVNGPFNIHLEKSKPGKIYFKQRGSDQGEYDIIKAADYSSRDLIIDDDYSSPVGLYPKWIKIESEVKPSVAVVSSNAEVEVLTQEEAENNTGSAVKEGDVLYYTMVDISASGLLNIVSLKNPGNLLAGITQLAVSNCMNENSGNSYFNQFWDSWTVNENYNNIKNGSLLAESIVAVKFTVGADNKDLIAVSNSDKDITDSEKYFTQITQEEYENIFNS